MKARIPKFEEEKKQEQLERAEELQRALQIFEDVISENANNVGIDIDEYKAMVYSSLFEGSGEIEFDEDFVKRINKSIYTDKKGEMFRNLLLEGKKRYEARVKQNSIYVEPTDPFLSRATLPLDFLLESNLAKHGHKQLSKLTSIDDCERLENIRETLIQVETLHKYSEEQAINIILEKDLLPDEVEILQERIKYLNRFKSTDSNSGEGR